MADLNCAFVRELQVGGCQNLRHCARLNTLFIQMISRWHILNNKVDLTNFFFQKNLVMGTITLIDRSLVTPELMKFSGYFSSRGV